MGNLPCTVCDKKQGNEMTEATLKNIQHSKNSALNLFSINQMIQAGWTLVGNAEGLILTSERME